MKEFSFEEEIAIIKNLNYKNIEIRKNRNLNLNYDILVIFDKIPYHVFLYNNNRYIYVYTGGKGIGHFERLLEFIEYLIKTTETSTTKNERI
jgi:hypothetical protein